MSTQKWTKELLRLAAEFGFTELRIETGHKAHLKLFAGKRLIMSASSTPSDPNVMHQYRRQLRAAKNSNYGLTR